MGRKPIQDNILRQIDIRTIILEQVFWSQCLFGGLLDIPWAGFVFYRVI